MQQQILTLTTQMESRKSKLIAEMMREFRKEEQETLNDITEKYGPGTLDPTTGVYTPTTEIQTQQSEK